MSLESLPVTSRDLRQALALCVAALETQAAANRQRYHMLRDKGETIAAAHVARETAESLDRLGASARAMLRAPDAKAAADQTQGGSLYFARLVDAEGDTVASESILYFDDSPDTAEEIAAALLESMRTPAPSGASLELFGPMALKAPQQFKPESL